MEKKNLSGRKAAGLAVFCLAALTVLAFRLLLGGVPPVKGGNDSQRRAFLFAMGYETGECVQDFVWIPADFSGLYGDYAQMQQRQGFDLRDYAAQKAVLYRYEIINLPGLRGKIYANLLIRDDFIIGGHLFLDSDPEKYYDFEFNGQNCLIFQ